MGGGSGAQQGATEPMVLGEHLPASQVRLGDQSAPQDYAMPGGPSRVRDQALDRMEIPQHSRQGNEWPPEGPLKPSHIPVT